MPWYPKDSDLTDYMRGQMESAYMHRERAKCSREDFFDGYMAALRTLRSRSSFKPGQFEPGESEAEG
jgi:hypothetical protein